MQRYFGEKKKDGTIHVTEQDWYHIKRVMRMKENDQIEVVIDGELFLCCLENVNQNMTISIVKQLEIKPDFMKKVILVVPILKEQKMDLILQKATELGVSEIVPTLMKRSVVKVEKNKNDKKLDRWNRIVKEASEQCMRVNVPLIHPIQTLQGVGKIKGTKIICSTTEVDYTLKKFLQSTKNYDTLVVVIGPEGGLDPSEEEQLQRYGFLKVSLGPRIMRVETVPIYMLSVLNYEYME